MTLGASLGFQKSDTGNFGVGERRAGLVGQDGTYGPLWIHHVVANCLGMGIGHVFQVVVVGLQIPQRPDAFDGGAHVLIDHRPVALIDIDAGDVQRQAVPVADAAGSHQ